VGLNAAPPVDTRGASATTLVSVGAHQAHVAATLRPAIACTECHGEHSLKVRTRQWDKLTGKLIADDGVRMVDTRPAATRPGS
jgi:hypothetical protein